MLDIDIKFYKGILFIRLNGELTKQTTTKLKNEVTNFIEKNGIKNIVFNIENLNEIDGYGINALLINDELCKKNKGQSLVCGINNNYIKHRLEHSRLLNYMYETSNELSAINVIGLKEEQWNN